MNEKDLLREGERVDELQRDGYRIIQHPDSFCFGMDAVLLSSYAEAKRGERALDLGTGTGIIPILMRAKTKCRDFTGLEIDETSARRAMRSVQLNGLEDSIRIIPGDLREVSSLFSPGSFDVVTSNPPYMVAGHGKTGKSGKGPERHELLCTLEDVVGGAARMLREQGRFYLIHRPFRLAEVMVSLSRHRLEPKRMRLVYPMADREPNLVLLEARKGANPRLTVEPPLIVYEQPGVYTRELLRIYREDPEETAGGAAN